MRTLQVVGLNSEAPTEDDITSVQVALSNPRLHIGTEIRKTGNGLILETWLRYHGAIAFLSGFLRQFNLQLTEEAASAASS